MPSPSLNMTESETEEPFFRAQMGAGETQRELMERMKKEFIERMTSNFEEPQIIYDSRAKWPLAPRNFNETNPDTGELYSFYTPESPKDDTLIFESRFEGGNLRRAIRVTDNWEEGGTNEYDLLCRPDINTTSYVQWFYFRLTNTRETRYKFNILNMLKANSLFNEGMRPLVYSEIEAKQTGFGWRRDGIDVCYYRNSKKYHTASFTINSAHENDTMYIAYCYPYVYSDLQKYLLSLETNPKTKKHMRRRVLCKTLCGNACDFLTITDFSCSPQRMRTKPIVWLSARVHPGESNASWIMQGVLDFLTGPSLKAHMLRQRYLFKIIPMLNPDGVVLGNYRCNLSGQDLNRQWANPSLRLHPTIYHAKLALLRLASERNVLLSTDFHGHSKAMNLFFYGCENNTDEKYRLEEKVFPFMFEQNSEAFSFESCYFKVQPNKSGSARVVFRREANLINSFTCEVSFAGSNTGSHAGLHYKIADLLNMGRDWCLTLLQYNDSKKRALAKSALEEIYPRPPLGRELEESEDENDSADSAEELQPPENGEKLLGIVDMSTSVRAKVNTLHMEDETSNESTAAILAKLHKGGRLNRIKSKLPNTIFEDGKSNPRIGRFKTAPSLSRQRLMNRKSERKRELKKRKSPMSGEGRRKSKNLAFQSALSSTFRGQRNGKGKGRRNSNKQGGLSTSSTAFARRQRKSQTESSVNDGQTVTGKKKTNILKMKKRINTPKLYSLQRSKNLAKSRAEAVQKRREASSKNDGPIFVPKIIRSDSLKDIKVPVAKPRASINNISLNLIKHQSMRVSSPSQRSSKIRSSHTRESLNAFQPSARGTKLEGRASFAAKGSFGLPMRIGEETCVRHELKLNISRDQTPPTTARRSFKPTRDMCRSQSALTPHSRSNISTVSTSVGNSGNGQSNGQSNGGGYGKRVTINIP